ncbi:MAG: hypothetical protein B1H08_00850 [Candidatus Omnitrophica bacterium 4484_171]|nr:MAG: hypothetical protein B1H08_00850 [Candidatus Omnitrophica bacterium 4484_171]
MALYKYIAKTRTGRTVKEVIDAGSKEEVVSRLKAKDLYIISINELGKEKKVRSFRRFLFLSKRGKHNKIKPLDMCYFARNLTITLSAGVPLLRSIEIISLQIESIGLANILNKVEEDIKRGFSLSESVEKYPYVFSPLWKGIIEVGEASGNLPFVLEKLADYLEMRIEFERKIKSALIYPGMVSSFGVIAVGVFFKFILPRFTQIFNQFDIKLPLITQILFNISQFVNKYFIFLIIVFIGGIAGVMYLKKKGIGRGFIDRLKLGLPLLSDFTLLVALERFSSTMYILLESGVPIVYTLEVIAKSIDNIVLEGAIDLMKDDVKKGKNLSSELSKIDIFPPLISEIARIGEETGNMPEMFKKLSEHYQKELTTKMERMIAIFEPAIIFLLGGIIGTIVIALFMPIFQLATLGNK